MSLTSINTSKSSMYNTYDFQTEINHPIAQNITLIIARRLQHSKFGFEHGQYDGFRIGKD